MRQEGTMRVQNCPPLFFQNERHSKSSLLQPLAKFVRQGHGNSPMYLCYKGCLEQSIYSYSHDLSAELMIAHLVQEAMIHQEELNDLILENVSMAHKNR